MTSLFLVGACLSLNSQNYKVYLVQKTTYLLEQDVVVFEMHRRFHQFYKSDYVDTHAKSVKCPKELK